EYRDGSSVRRAATNPLRKAAAWRAPAGFFPHRTNCGWDSSTVLWQIQLRAMQLRLTRGTGSHLSFRIRADERSTARATLCWIQRQFDARGPSSRVQQRSSAEMSAAPLQEQ